MKRKAQSAFRRGNALLARGEIPGAIAELRRARELDPDSDHAAFALGCAWLEAGEAGIALDLLLPLASRKGECRQAARGAMRRAYGLLALDRSPPAYIRHLFDQFAGDYDRSMVRDLRYTAPAILSQMAEMLLPAGRHLDILDLGCGTGLAGELFKPTARRLDGLDLSPRMIAKAAAKGIYSRLVTGDIEQFLGRSRTSYDLVIAADTLVYFGGLAAIFRGARNRLRSGGQFPFTLERHDGAGYVLGPKRRYRHSAAYIRETAAASGLDCMGMIECTPRQDAGEAVAGFAVALG